jgi:hypothetical protein
MPTTTLVLVLLYIALLFTLTLIVRREYVRRRDWPGPKLEDLERRIRFPYCPPPDRRQRTFDWTSELKPIKRSRNSYRLG